MTDLPPTPIVVLPILLKVVEKNKVPEANKSTPRNLKTVPHATEKLTLNQSFNAFPWQLGTIGPICILQNHFQSISHEILHYMNVLLGRNRQFLIIKRKLDFEGWSIPYFKLYQAKMLCFLLCYIIKQKIWQNYS